MKLRRNIYTLIIFSIVYLLTIPVSSAQHYAAEYGWYFLNFPTPGLSWEIYKNTFIGIPPTHDSAASAIETLFYDEVYKPGIGNHGDCYGMSLLGLLIEQKGGYLGFCQPIPAYSGDINGKGPGGVNAGPTDPRLKRAINMMHGHQLNLASLKFYLELIAIGKHRDGLYAFDQAQGYMMRNDPVIVSLSRSASPTDGAHAMTVYKTMDYGADDKRLYLYDSNRSWYDPDTKYFYEDGLNYIRIKSDHSWEYEMPSGMWSGSPSSGGGITIIPISMAGPTSRSAASLGLGVLYYAHEFFFSGATLEQITNAKGKRLFKPGTKEIDNDPATGMLNMVPWFPANGGEPYDFEVYFLFGNPGGVLDIQVRSSASGYEMITAGRRGFLRVQAEGGRGVDQIHLEHPGSTAPLLTLQNNLDADRFNVQFTQIIHPKSQFRTFKLSNLSTPKDTPVQFSVIKNQTALEMKSDRASLAYDLQINSRYKTDDKTVDLTGLQINSGESQIIRPKNWMDLKTDSVQIISKQTPGIPICVQASDLYDAAVNDLLYVDWRSVKIEHARAHDGSPIKLSVEDCDGDGQLDVLIPYSEADGEFAAIRFPASACDGIAPKEVQVELTHQTGVTFYAKGDDARIVSTAQSQESTKVITETVTLRSEQGIRWIEIEGSNLCIKKICWECYK